MTGLCNWTINTSREAELAANQQDSPQPCYPATETALRRQPSTLPMETTLHTETTLPKETTMQVSTPQYIEECHRIIKECGRWTRESLKTYTKRPILHIAGCEGTCITKETKSMRESWNASKEEQVNHDYKVRQLQAHGQDICVKASYVQDQEKMVDTKDLSSWVDVNCTSQRNPAQLKCQQREAGGPWQLAVCKATNVFSRGS